MSKILSLKILLVIVGIAIVIDGSLWWYARTHSSANNVRRQLTHQTTALFQQVTTTTTGEDEITTVQYDLVHNAARTTTTIQGRPVSDAIVIGSHYYIKDAVDGTWWAQTVDHPNDNQRVLATAAAYANSLHQTMPYKGFAADGTQPCASRKCIAYTKSDRGTTSTLFVDPVAGLLQKTTATSANMTITMRYSYKHIVVPVPSPTKPVPPDSSIFDYVTGTDAVTDTHASTAEREELQKLQQQLNTPPQ